MRRSDFWKPAMAAAFIVIGAAGPAIAQTSESPPPEAKDGLSQDEKAQAMRGMHEKMMRDGGRMQGMMHRQMMKVMFAIADADNDGALSFEEVTTIHRRIFDKVDVNRDGKVTPDEIQTFFRN